MQPPRQVVLQESKERLGGSYASKYQPQTQQTPSLSKIAAVVLAGGQYL